MRMLKIAICEDSEIFVEIIKKYNKHFDKPLDNSILDYFVRTIPVDKYENMREINKKIKIEFVKYIERIGKDFKA